MANQDSMDIIKANQNLEAYQARILELESENQVLRDENVLYNKKYLELEAKLKKAEADIEQFGQAILKATGLCHFSDGKADLDGLSALIIDRLAITRL